MTSLMRPASTSHAHACSVLIQPFFRATPTDFSSVASSSQRSVAARIRPNRKAEKSCFSGCELVFDTGLYSFCAACDGVGGRLRELRRLLLIRLRLTRSHQRSAR